MPVNKGSHAQLDLTSYRFRAARIFSSATPPVAQRVSRAHTPKQCSCTIIHTGTNIRICGARWIFDKICMPPFRNPNSARSSGHVRAGLIIWPVKAPISLSILSLCNLSVLCSALLEKKTPIRGGRWLLWCCSYVQQRGLH